MKSAAGMSHKASETPPKRTQGIKPGRRVTGSFTVSVEDSVFIWDFPFGFLPATSAGFIRDF
jgi:hypothetical protein